MRFEELLKEHRGAIERYVHFRLPNSADAEDVLQETYLTAYKKFETLKNKDSFKPWMISIAKNKCNDWFRLYKPEISIDSLEFEPDLSRFGITELQVSDTLNQLKNSDREILYMYFWEELTQKEIAARLNLPVGTVKSRLFTAKQNFKEKYPCYSEGEIYMKRIPEFLPEYKIEESKLSPFNVKCEELMGWLLIPKEGEKLSWGIYDNPTRKCSQIFDMKVTGKAKVHGIEGVELTAKETFLNKSKSTIDRVFVAQLTDTHCRYLATIRNDGDVKNYITFLDGDEFLPNWGYGENNCGKETNLTPKGNIVRNGNTITTSDTEFITDIAGRYNVTINGKTYDTVCVMDIETYNCGVISEQYIDSNGRTVLWRRFNRNDWAIERYKKPWTELLPNNETLTVNGNTYVHWYDCISDYIF